MLVVLCTRHNKRERISIAVSVAHLLLAIVLALSANGFARAEKHVEAIYKIDIERSSVEQALKTLAQQTGTQLFFPFDLVETLEAIPVRGEYTITQALAILLHDTGLSGGLTRRGVISISRITPNKIAGEKMKTKKKLLSVVMAFLFSSEGTHIAQAQESENNKSSRAANDTPTIEEVIVTAGYRASLKKAMDIKRDNVGFSDSIVATDINEFPDQNLAEALQRTSGVTITRDNGEGQQISLRGLGPSFARVLWNGVPISTASDGGTDVSAGNREFDFDVFSSELFSRVDVAKSAAAHHVEGGIGGVVNLRNARPFDFEGFNTSFSLEGGYQELSEEVDPRMSLIVSNIFADDTFGVLFGITRSERTFRVDGFETFDWVSPAVNGFSYDLSEGNQSGLSDEALNNLLLPRLPRTELQIGKRERVSFLGALQFRPHEDIEINVDLLGANLDNDVERHNLDVEIRSQNDLVPLDAVVGSDNSLRSIRLLNANRRSENRVVHQETEQLHLALSGTWFVNEDFKVDAVASYAKSEYDRRQTTFLARALDTEIVLSTSGGSKSIPQIRSTTDITNPDNFIFDLIRVEPTSREETNTAFQIDATWGGFDSNVRFGLAYNDFSRDAVGYRASGNPADFTGNLPALAQIAATLPVSDFLGILDASDGVITDHLVIDIDAAKQYFDLDAMDANAPLRESSTNTADETSLSGYAEINHSSDFIGRELRINAGARIVNTTVDVSAPFLGTELQFENSYTKVLPSFSLSWEVKDNVIIRFAGARAMTRPDVSKLVPNTDFSTDFIVKSGNPELEPFLSDQLDIGVEWYFAEESILAVSAYQKDISGFIQDTTSQGPFSDSGIPLSILDPQIFVNITPSTIVDYNKPDNVSDATEITGLELLYQQPLNFIAEGAGVMVNFSHIDGDTSFTAANNVEVPSNIVGLSENNYNIVLYYEQEGFSVRGSWNYRDDFVTAPCCRNGQPFLRTREGSGQLDLSATYDLPFADNYTLTFEAINVNENEEYTYFGDSANLQRYIGTGRQFFVGIKGSFE
jgi:iron complex outermembrane recepter protein